MAGEQPRVTTIESEIVHLDFEAELPCEEAPCVTSSHVNAAELRLYSHCKHCQASDFELICQRCWGWLLSFSGFECGLCKGDLGTARDCCRVEPIKSKS